MDDDNDAIDWEDESEVEEEVEELEQEVEVEELEQEVEEEEEEEEELEQEVEKDLVLENIDVDIELMKAVNVGVLTRLIPNCLELEDADENVRRRFGNTTASFLGDHSFIWDCLPENVMDEDIKEGVLGVTLGTVINEIQPEVTPYRSIPKSHVFSLFKLTLPGIVEMPPNADEENAEQFLTQQFLHAVRTQNFTTFQQPYNGVVATPVITKSFGGLLITEALSFQKFIACLKKEVEKPVSEQIERFADEKLKGWIQSLSSEYFSLTDMGLDQVAQQLMTEYIQPVASHFFPEVGLLDECVASISIIEVQHKVPIQIDPAHITAVICLGQYGVVLGGEMQFGDKFCANHPAEHIKGIAKLNCHYGVGSGFIFHGMLQYGIHTVNSGTSVLLKLSCRNSMFEFKQRKLCCWCKNRVRSP